MSENILGALFHPTKPYAAAAFDQRERCWTRRVSEPLAGKTLGIIGLGAIGREVARKAAVLEMRVIGARRTGASVAGVERVYPGLHPERDRIVAGLWVENLRRFLDGRDLLEVVHHARGY